MMRRTMNVCFVALSLAAVGIARAEGRPTEAFRQEHVEVREHLGHLDAMVGKLEKQGTADRKKTMKFVVGFLNDHIRAHAEAEEKALYPVVDKQVAGGAQPFTATMRYEHRIIGRWIDDLEREQAKAEPDARAFARKADRLLGVISAHFEKEEEVLLPILDASMTRERFEREVSAKMGGH